MVTIKIKLKQNYLDMLIQKSHHLNVGINQQEHDMYVYYSGYNFLSEICPWTLLIQMTLKNIDDSNHTSESLRYKYLKYTNNTGLVIT